MILENKTIIISAGGTGGHVYPALALAKALREKGAKILWIGSEHGIENKLVPEQNISLYRVAMLGIRRNGFKRKMLAPFILLKSLKQAIKVFTDNKPDLYIGFGGFVTAPSGIAAKLTGTPIILHDQNATMGLVNRYLRHIANRMLLAFPIKQFPMEKYSSMGYQIIGNPVRDSISNIDVDARFGRKQHVVGNDKTATDIEHYENVEISKTKNNCRLLIVGGSQGSKAINENIVLALDLVKSNIDVIHQTGDRTYQATVDSYYENAIAKKVNITLDVSKYIDNIDEIYSKTDLVIARSGAMTVTELASAGLPSILIPLPSAVDNHQVLNAEFLVNSKSAIMIEEKDLTPQLLSQTIDELIINNQLFTMAKQAKLQSHANALNDFVNIVIDLIADKTSKKNNNNVG